MLLLQVAVAAAEIAAAAATKSGTMPRALKHTGLGFLFIEGMPIRMYGSGLIQLWIVGSGAVHVQSRNGSVVVHIWFTYVSGVVQVWFSVGSGLLQVWIRLG